MMKKAILAVCLAALWGAAGAYWHVHAQGPDDYYSSVETALNTVETEMDTGEREVFIVGQETDGDGFFDKGEPAQAADTDTSGELYGEALTDQPAEEQGAGIAASVPSETKDIMIDVLDLKEMDITDALKLLSRKSGLNIIAGQNVKGKVTVYLQNVEIHEVLRIIVEANDLAYVEDGRVIRVMPAREYEAMYGRRFSERTELWTVQLKYASAADAVTLLNQIKSAIGKVVGDDKSNTIALIDIPDRLRAMKSLIDEIDVPVVTEVFSLDYADAEDIAKQIGDVLTKNVGSVRHDTRSNKVVVADTPKKIDEIRKMVEAFDERHREVLIEAKILSIVLSDQYKLGVNWEAIVSNYHDLTLKSDFGVLSATDKRGKLSIGTISSDDYTVLVEALQAVGTTNILSSPRITTINNKEARILVGSTEPYVTTTTTTPAGGTATTAESVNFIEVGVKLYVTPTIHSDDYVTMKIKPEVSSVSRFLKTSQNNTIPVVETSEAETTVMVKDGVTIVIGGLIKDEIIETVNKIPLFGDLPLIGFAFRNQESLVRKTELVIFLTPRIISGDALVR